MSNTCHHAPCDVPYGPNLFSYQGGSIGTGLFVGSGTALGVGGPAGLLVAYLIVAVMLINVTQVGNQNTF